MTDNSKIIAKIRDCRDAGTLKLWLKNARDKGAADVAEAAFRQLISIVPEADPGSIEHDFWQTINAFEQTLSDERGKTVRLQRTRQKVQRVGVVQTLQDWAVSPKKTDGFEMLLARGMPEFTGEAIVLRHPGQFEQRVLDAARAKLDSAGVDPKSYPAEVCGYRSDVIKSK